ncbi:hypothetical protein [Agreia sp. VKM Ac-1783]|uniref:hypothetical protein n=1 Tax=Agreia sp. VKM Ac-1783 TaxID=1938889 RepID=UPI000A2ABE01|nr:hypothetical protein [Agreia sp. VKM Ac-1783]SMQ73434.1 hypothetical protein SAMN06295943_2874 [Agreia sp. VKM Ac-1783]
MFYNDWFQIPYLAFMVALFIGAIVLLVLLGRLILAATAALQSYRRVQEVKIELLIADGTDEPKL